VARRAQRPHALALADPPNRGGLGLGPARSFSYREADAAVDALGRCFIDLGLEPGDRIAVQLPNIAEQPLTILAAWRVGLTVCMLPMLWRQTEIGNVCAQLSPKALVGVGGFAGESQARALCQIAAMHMSVRFVLGFGRELPDGVTALDDALQAVRSVAPVEPRERDGPAMVTFTARANAPLVPVFLRGQGRKSA
jgi:non-ribosomal peptide synthetase component E (peptide arylation enzyme)